MPARYDIMARRLSPQAVDASNSAAERCPTGPE